MIANITKNLLFSIWYFMEIYLPYIHTAVIAVWWMLAILSLILWLDRMIRIIMANYLIASILLGMWNFIDLVSSQWLIVDGQTQRWVDGLQSRIWKLLIAGKPTLLLTTYFILLIFIVNKAHIGVGKVRNEGLRWILTVIFLPCTVISILVTLALAIYGNQVFDINQLRFLADYFVSNPIIHNFIMLTPLRIILPWLATIVVAALVIRTKDEIIVREVIVEEEMMEG